MPTNCTKNYLVTIKSYLPYPVVKEYRIPATSLATATSRGIKKFRADKKGKVIVELAINVICLGRGI